MVDHPTTRDPGAGALPDYRVLVADDDPSCRGSLMSLLALEGFQTLPVGCGADVLMEVRDCYRRDPEAARGGDANPVVDRIDFLVLDYNMPDLTGLDVIRRVRIDLGVWLPAIVVSGEFSPDLERSVLEEGGFALVPKPIQPTPFRQLVWRLVQSELA